MKNKKILEKVVLLMLIFYVFSLNNNSHYKKSIVRTAHINRKTIKYGIVRTARFINNRSKINK